MITPCVSIVMPCYNAAPHLARSIGSVIAQTFAKWELVVVDDGSKDDSWAALEWLCAADPRIRAFRQTNAGAAAARNRALHEARGPFISFLDADDTWHPEFLATMLATLEGETDQAIAYCGWQNLGLGGNRDLPFVPPEYEGRDKTESLLGGCRWPIHAVLVPAAVIRGVGGFDESLSSCMDYDLWLRVGCVHRLIRVPRVLAYYHHHTGEQITKNRARIAINHWRAQQKFLRANPGVTVQLGTSRIQALTTGELLRRGYESYWKRDLPAARKIFRMVMKEGYGTPTDWKYMLPALLPEALHKRLIGALAGSNVRGKG
jgi:glycosyltransferase involved in cell wall biosynthesis